MQIISFTEYLKFLNLQRQYLKLSLIDVNFLNLNYYNFFLSYKEIPVEFVHKITNQTVKEKETATFSCQLNKENAQVKWFKGGLEILPTDNKYKYITDGNKYSLQILDCQLDDDNDYAIFYRGRKCLAHLQVDG